MEETKVKTLEEAAETPGAYLKDNGLGCHFSPIANWYMSGGFDCPCCGQPIDWTWQWAGEKPMVTGPETPRSATPVLTGAVCIAHGHRWMRLQCGKCQTLLFCENFD